MAQEALYASVATSVRRSVVFGCAILAAVAADQLMAAPRIFGALAATIVLAVLARLILSQLPQLYAQSRLRDFVQLFVDFVVALTGLAILVYVAPAAQNFVCEPLVPWGIWIAVFGSLVIGFLGMASTRDNADPNMSLMVLLSVFWIAPFFGYFYGPWFLAQAVVMPCPGRSQYQSMVVAIVMIPAAAVGRMLARWLLKRHG